MFVKTEDWKILVIFQGNV